MPPLSEVPAEVVGADSPLAGYLCRGLAAVERELAAATADIDRVLAGAWRPPPVRGLRLCPALVLLAGYDAGVREPPDVVVRTGCLAELTQGAALAHTAVPPGPGATSPDRPDVLAGDLLLIRSIGLAADLPTRVVRVWADGLRVVHELYLVGRPDAAAAAGRRYCLALGRAAAPGRRRPADAAAAAVLRRVRAHVAGVSRWPAVMPTPAGSAPAGR